jgi:hypothetical protein
MPTIEQQAYSCMDSHGCGNDFDNSSTIQCVSNNCMKEYSTYITRFSNDLFSDFPSCLVARMVGNSDYYTLLTKAQAYKPTGDGSQSSTSTSSALSASLSWIALVSFALFFFHF